MTVRKSPARTAGALLPAVFDLPRLVLVEGADDAEVIARLLAGSGGADTVVHDMKGKDEWRTKVAAIAEDPTFRERVKAVALIRDAESDAAATFDSCRGALLASRLPAPQRQGQVIEEGGKRLGIFLLPGGEKTGMLEDLVLRAGDPLRIGASVSFLDELLTRGLPAPRTRAKAMLQSYLAGEERSPRDLWLGIQQQVFDLEHGCFDQLRAFLADMNPTSSG